MADERSVVQVPTTTLRVASVLAHAHPFVRQVRTRLNAASHPQRGLFICADPLSIEVSRETQGRALRIMDAVVKALEASGCKVRPWEDYGRPGHAVVRGENLRFSLKEALHRTLHQLEDKENPRWAARYDLHPSGQLRFRVWWDDAGYRGHFDWKDGKKTSLEQQAQQMFAGFFHAAAECKAKREFLASAAQRRDEEAVLRRQEELKHESERQLAEQLHQAARAFRDARDLRTFIEAAKAMAHAARSETLYGRPVDEWKRWAEAVADALDPLGQSSEHAEDEGDEIL